MAIKPQILAKLRHGKLICQAIYPTFVETWNWLVRFTSTMKGDFETNPQKGVIVVDRTDPDHPIIRLRQDRLPASKVWTGPFNPQTDEDGKVSGFEYCYWQLGGKTYLLGDQTLGASNGFVCLKAGTTTTTAGTASLAYYGDLSALQAAQANPEFFIVPLYVVESSKITVDLRRIPHIYTAEVL